MAKDQSHSHRSEDPFLRNYKPSELRIASDFFSTWFPFLSKGLCPQCSQFLSDRIRSIHPDPESHNLDENSNNNLQLRETSDNSNNLNDNCDTHSIGSWKDEKSSICESTLVETPSPKMSWKEEKSSTCESTLVETPSPRMSWADMAQEDEFAEEEYAPKNNYNLSSITKTLAEPKLPREQREYIRFMNVGRKKDFVCLERVKGRLVNTAEGLELHTDIFSAAEQKRIVDFVALLQNMGKKRQLKERTYSAPQKWMRGKGRQTIQFGCCYNYAKDRDGNPPGILPDSMVDPIPDLFKGIIRRLVRWHVLPPTCVPDSCIVNIYEEGDCIPPHIDNHDFLRPFCTVSFLSECNIAFGSNLKIVGAGEFEGSISIPLPVGSVLVLNGNGADVAKHCVPAVPTKRISITFRRMDVSKRPNWYVEEPDLQGIEPLSYEADKETRSNGSKATPDLQGIQSLVYEVDKERRSNGSRATPDLQGIRPSVYEVDKERRSNGSPATPDLQRIQPLVYEVDKERRSNGSPTTPDLQRIQPLVYEVDKERWSNGSRANRQPKTQNYRRDTRIGSMGSEVRSDRFWEPRELTQSPHTPANRWRVKSGN